MLWIRYSDWPIVKRVMIGPFQELGKLDELDTMGSYVYDLDETHLEINRKRFQSKWTGSGSEMDRNRTGSRPEMRFRALKGKESSLDSQKLTFM